MTLFRKSIMEYPSQWRRPSIHSGDSDPRADKFFLYIEPSLPSLVSSFLPPPNLPPPRCMSPRHTRRPLDDDDERGDSHHNHLPRHPALSNNLVLTSHNGRQPPMSVAINGTPTNALHSPRPPLSVTNAAPPPQNPAPQPNGTPLSSIQKLAQANESTWLLLGAHPSLLLHLQHPL